MSHDQNFKNLILDYPREALAFFAAEEAVNIDAAARILPVRQEQLKERLGDRFHELDVPLLVEWPDGQREALLFILEEESDPRRFSIHRLAHYSLHLAELFNTDRVVPVVIFLRDGKIAEQLHLGGDRHTYLSFRYLACHLPRLDWQAYRDSQNLTARLNLPNMHYAPERRVEVYAHAVRGLFELEPDPEKQIKYIDFIDIYTALEPDELERYCQEYSEDVQKMSSFAKRHLEQGRQEGMQQGMQQGEARILLRQMERKFGKVSVEVRQRINQADESTLLEWSERILTANSPEEVLH